MPGFAFQRGDQLDYQFTSNGTLTLGATEAGTLIQISETGQFEVEVYATSATGWLLGFRWKDVKLTQNNNGNSQDLTPPDLASTAILVSLEKSGRIAQVQVPYSLSADARNAWRDMLAKWQVILPQTAAKKWTRVEEDATGTFVAQYALAAAAITKGKTHYLRINGANALLTAAYKVSGSAQIEFANYPRIITGEETVAFGGVNGLPPTHSTGKYSFELTSVSANGKFAPPDLAGYTSLVWATEFGPSSAPPEDEGNFADNVRDLQALIQTGHFGSPEQIGVAGKLISQLKKDPALADRLLDELRSDGVTTQLASSILGILGAAGTPAAQDDLLAVAASEDWPAAMRQMALYAFVQVTDPVSEADTTLTNLFAQGGDLSSSSLLVLAAIGDKVRNSDPARFQQINDFVAKVLNTPGLSLNDFIVALDAIGNLGPTPVPEVVAKATSNENDVIRAKAIASLARVKTDAALALVTNALINDPSGDVQAAAVKTLAALKGAAAADDLAKVAANGKSDSARQAALTQLVDIAPTAANTTSVLSNAAKTDPSETVRDYAAKLLSSLPGNTLAPTSPQP